MADMTYGDLTTYGALDTYAFQTSSGGGSDDPGNTNDSTSCPWSSSTVSDLIQAISDLTTAVQNLQTDITAIKGKTDYLPSSTTTTAIASAVWEQAISSYSSGSTKMGHLVASISGIPTKVWNTTVSKSTVSSGYPAAAIADKIWGRTGNDTTSRTLDGTANSAISTAVWGASTKEVTITSSQASNFATPTNVTDAKNAILNRGNSAWTTAVIPNDYAKPSDIPTPPNTTSIANAVWGRTGNETGSAATARTLTTDIGQTVWAYTNGQSDTSSSRTLTSGGSGGSGISASDVWTYGSNNDKVADIAAAVWSYMDTNQSTNSRTLTSGGGSGGLTAADVWNYGNTGTQITTRTLTDDVNVSTASVNAIQSGLSTFDPSNDKVTVNDTQATAFSAVTPATNISGLATASALSTLAGKVDNIKSKTDNLPANTATVLSGLSTFNPSTTAVTLGSLTVGIGATPSDANTIASKSFITSTITTSGGSSGHNDTQVPTPEAQEGASSDSSIAEALSSIEEAIQALPDVIWGRDQNDVESRTLTSLEGLGIADDVWGRVTGDTSSRTLTTVAGLGIASEDTVKMLVGQNNSTQAALGVKDIDGNTSISLVVARDSNNQILSIK